LVAEDDKTDLLALYDACTEADLDEVDIYVDKPDPLIFGMFEKARQQVEGRGRRSWKRCVCDSSSRFDGQSYERRRSR
jgi:hypothetical protein